MTKEVLALLREHHFEPALHDLSDAIPEAIGFVERVAAGTD
jgi:hypothetical protein